MRRRYWWCRVKDFNNNKQIMDLLKVIINDVLHLINNPMVIGELKWSNKYKYQKENNYYENKRLSAKLTRI